MESSAVQEIPLTNEILNGKWVLDSIHPSMSSCQEDLFFVNGKMYRYSYWRNGYLIDSATYENSEVKSFLNRTYSLRLIDSTHLEIKSRVKYYYRKVREDKINEALESYRIGDKARSEYIGYWVPQNIPNKRIKIMNHSPECDSVSFQIFGNGSTEFYVNLNFDSIVHHGFRLDGNSPQFGNGCLVGDYDLSWNKSRTQLGLVFSMFYPDTVWFEKRSR